MYKGKGEHGHGVAFAQDDGCEDRVSKKAPRSFTGDPSVDEILAVGSTHVAVRAKGKCSQSVMGGSNRGGQEEGGGGLPRGQVRPTQWRCSSAMCDTACEAGPPYIDCSVPQEERPRGRPGRGHLMLATGGEDTGRCGGKEGNYEPCDQEVVAA